VASPSPADFGKYELLERLAVGGMAELYRARFHAVAGVTKPVVIKKILPAFADSQAFVSMFVNEARIAVSLSHGNIAQVFDFGAVEGEYFLAMEYVHGQPLSRVLRRAYALQFPFLPEPIALQIAIDMCRGLHYAHTRTDEAGQPLHIIHHDVSPQNVLVGYAGEVKIVDFGIARARHATNTEMQTTGVKGKYPYFSPEQARGEAVDLRTDVYATGVVLYQMLCGRLPHKGPLVQTMQSIVRGEYPPPRSLNPGLTPELERAVMIAMAYRAEDRFATALALADALSAVLHGLGPRPPTVRDFMGFLFEPELLAEGADVKPSRAVLELVPQWRRGGRPMSVPDSVPSNTTASVRRLPLARGRRWAALWVGGVALLVGVLLAATLGRSPTFDVELRSDPPGASVEVDGRPVPGATPLRIHGLGTAQGHKIRVRMRGRQDWTSEVRGLSGTTVRLQADLAEPPAPP
jgi:eukaryotic-like serine/threonine-protein kinase